MTYPPLAYPLLRHVEKIHIAPLQGLLTDFSTLKLGTPMKGTPEAPLEPRADFSFPILAGHFGYFLFFFCSGAGEREEVSEEVAGGVGFN